MTDRQMTGAQQDQLEALVDACGLDLVLGALANICALKSGHVDENGQGAGLAKAWLRAMTICDCASLAKSVAVISG